MVDVDDDAAEICITAAMVVYVVVVVVTGVWKGRYRLDLRTVLWRVMHFGDGAGNVDVRRVSKLGWRLITSCVL